MNEAPRGGPVLLHYNLWAEEALLEVVIRALDAASPDTMPGDHHYYLTFRTDYPGVVLPGHLRARYRDEMTVVLQHRFWDLKVDRAARTISVSLSFGAASATVSFPFEALVSFVDPHAGFGLRFQAIREAAAARTANQDKDSAANGGEITEPRPLVADAVDEATQDGVVSLDVFRRRRT